MGTYFQSPLLPSCLHHDSPVNQPLANDLLRAGGVLLPNSVIPAEWQALLESSKSHLLGCSSSVCSPLRTTRDQWTCQSLRLRVKSHSILQTTSGNFGVHVDCNRNRTVGVCWIFELPSRALEGWTGPGLSLDAGTIHLFTRGSRQLVELLLA